MWIKIDGGSQGWGAKFVESNDYNVIVDGLVETSVILWFKDECTANAMIQLLSEEVMEVEINYPPSHY